ncbi:MAG TPA: YlxR family protein [Clostridiaceae bacterium]|nr:YlxR family protein [Clostridiaceae bacterium]
MPRAGDCGPIRMCLCCRRRQTKDKLFRLVRSRTGNLVWDREGKAQARGYYICRTEDCLETILSNRKEQFSRSGNDLEEMMACLVAEKDSVGHHSGSGD